MTIPRAPCWLLLLIGSCSPELGALPPKVLLVGWDGASFELIDPLIKAGRLPNLAGLQARGRSAFLESTRIPISSAAWTSAFSGVGPGETGVFGFFEPTEDKNQVKLISSHSNNEKSQVSSRSPGFTLHRSGASMRCAKQISHSERHSCSSIPWPTYPACCLRYPGAGSS